jgi:hypothetical protein
MFFGAAPQPLMREAFTYVLKGHVNLGTHLTRVTSTKVQVLTQAHAGMLSLGSAVFPRGTLGAYKRTKTHADYLRY